MTENIAIEWESIHKQTSLLYHSIVLATILVEIEHIIRISNPLAEWSRTLLSSTQTKICITQCYG
ncbi:hypothetical protein HYC85_007123 [Camellia sinensis]|uniref:Uncharacterized protein n=1 Tax=Camellia sinensis TaxID=4442 RepID=A0A7J7HPC2_CAMSI|nr:hypothetical protein HYC85_007123 [Camellia sinensis]